ncbi:DUF1684 domain-containing protein [Rhodococcus sp. USK10]|uniref:DUF1684 domain-containing protein n=1 Tax=Rhodococcus sp. USK10 TaxID=2789739 RepID=UPI001C5FB9AB|nr:DUF1684 domain-containing protein [Rhodococcus sp. USK10]QYB06232.1 DUF1684 domain-containing protein [Rhodococcus sp. USK10]
MTAVTEDATFEQGWQDWHSAREDYFREPLGWLSLTALHWLVETDTTFPDLPGKWRADADGLIVTAPADAGLEIDGETVDGTATLAPQEGAPGLLVRHGNRTVEVIRRTGDVALRIHDPEAATLAAFTGIPAFLPARQWAVPATFTPFPQSRVVTTGAVVEGLEHHHTALGSLAFEYDGAAHELVAFAGKDGGLQVLFTDATSGVTTYPAARSLAVDVPAADGRVTLDFNRASNLPCAFTDYATCPVAPAENRLTLAVEAGEKNPR